MRPMNRLRSKLFEAEITQADLGKMLGHSGQYISDRMQAIYAFNIWEVYELCRILDIPFEDIPIYFPDKKKN